MKILIIPTVNQTKTSTLNRLTERSEKEMGGHWTHQLSPITPAGWTPDYPWRARCRTRSRSHRTWPCTGSCLRWGAPGRCLSTWWRFLSPARCAEFCGPAGCPGRGSWLTQGFRSALHCYASCRLWGCKVIWLPLESSCKKLLKLTPFWSTITSWAWGSKATVSNCNVIQGVKCCVDVV